MERIKEFWGIITDAPKEIGENLTPLAKWTVWIPLSIGAIILIIVLVTVLGIAHMFNKATMNFIPKLYTIIKGKLIKKPSIVDSSYPVTFAHPKYWIDKEGRHPDPFTNITKEDIESGKWKPVNNKDNQ